jgi:hypothetical protein|tara:strand:+ start:5608 stop:5781 length:174 start_codon:yes stop_codon:yes gene_type:complete
MVEIEHVLNVFIEGMQSLDFDNEEIIKAVIERCDPDLSPFYEELVQQEKHIKEIINA